MIQTTNCVKCGVSNVPMIIGGHVHKDTEIIIATVCTKCENPAEEHIIQIMNNCKGCYGQWIPAYGYEKNSNGEVVYIDS